MSEFINDTERVSKKVAREILSMIEDVCFSTEFDEFRIKHGSNGERDLIIKQIREQYDVR